MQYPRALMVASLLLAPLKQRKTSESAQILSFKKLENEHWLHVGKKSITMKIFVPQWITPKRLGGMDHSPSWENCLTRKQIFEQCSKSTSLSNCVVSLMPNGGIQMV